MRKRLTWAVPEKVVLIKPTHRAWSRYWEELTVADQAVLRRAADQGYDWPKEGVLLWREPSKASQRASPGRRVLVRFAALAEANGEAFKDFASSYGPLHLCRHGQPLGHRFLLPDSIPTWRDRTTLGGDPTEAAAADFAKASLEAEWLARLKNLPCAQTIRPPESLVSESIADWRRLAVQVAHTRSIIEHLNCDRPAPPGLWRSFEATVEEPVEAWLPDPEDPVGGYDVDTWAGLPALRRRTLTVNEQRRWLAFFIDEWLRQSLLRPRFFWEPGRRGLEQMGPGSLYASLILELAEEAAAGTSVICVNCERTFKASRKPAVGRDVYCERTACKAARKVAHRRRGSP